MLPKIKPKQNYIAVSYGKLKKKEKKKLIKINVYAAFSARKSSM